MPAEQRPPSAPLLVVEDLHVAYGKAEVVHGVSLAIRDGEFAVMLGRNGAGKSTIMHAISGLIPKVQGRVRFDGQDISASGPAEIVKLGLVQVLQGHRVFTSLSVEDNLLLGTYATHPHGDARSSTASIRSFPRWPRSGTTRRRACQVDSNRSSPSLRA